ncbi:MAG: glutamate--tRNA ligase [Acidobacteria bacterium]|nr:glutamate--tRNA ligase [Acidobacteriota bacterium]
MNSENQVRVRFAPSPTGYLHVGNVRTALFNWLWARHFNGSFILRIEDTDAERSKAQYEKQLMEDLRWLGLEWNEGVDCGGSYGPYRQSDRYEIYQKYAQQLLEEDKAFRCFCSEEELENHRRQRLASGETARYSGKCRHLSAAELDARLRSNTPFTLRLRVRPGTVGFSDLVFGRVEIETVQISDPVLLRSDGSPTYNFCCVIDDFLMKITHVIRGDGHLSNTHRQILIYEALSAPIPEFAHLSTILGPDGQKLSKRHGATSIEEFHRQGYLPEALANYLALLGWSSPNEGQEVMSLDEIAQQFDLSRIIKHPAIFDNVKLDWMNRTYIIKTNGNDLVDDAGEFFAEAGLVPAKLEPDVRSWLAQAIDLTKTHVDHLDQLPREAGIVYGFEKDPPELDADAREALGNPDGKAVAMEFMRLALEKESLSPESYREIVAQVKANTRQKGRNLFHPIRAALTGRGSGPDLERLIPLFETGSRLNLPRKVMSCRERLQAILGAELHELN